MGLQARNLSRLPFPPFRLPPSLSFPLFLRSIFLFLLLLLFSLISSFSYSLTSSFYFRFHFVNFPSVLRFDLPSLSLFYFFLFFPSPCYPFFFLSSLSFSFYSFLPLPSSLFLSPSSLYTFSPPPCLHLSSFPSSSLPSIILTHSPSSSFYAIPSPSSALPSYPPLISPFLPFPCNPSTPPPLHACDSVASPSLPLGVTVCPARRKELVMEGKVACQVGVLEPITPRLAKGFLKACG